MTWNVILYKSLKSDECLQIWLIFSARHFYRKYQASWIATENIPIRRTWNVILYKSPKLDSPQYNTIKVFYCFSPYLHFAPLFLFDVGIHGVELMGWLIPYLKLRISCWEWKVEGKGPVSTDAKKKQKVRHSFPYSASTCSRTSMTSFLLCSIESVDKPHLVCLVLRYLKLSVYLSVVRKKESG